MPRPRDISITPRPRDLSVYQLIGRNETATMTSKLTGEGDEDDDDVVQTNIAIFSNKQ